MLLGAGFQLLNAIFVSVNPLHLSWCKPPIPQKAFQLHQAPTDNFMQKYIIYRAVKRTLHFHMQLQEAACSQDLFGLFLISYLEESLSLQQLHLRAATYPSPFVFTCWVKSPKWNWATQRCHWPISKLLHVLQRFISNKTPPLWYLHPLPSPFSTVGSKLCESVSFKRIIPWVLTG